MDETWIHHFTPKSNRHSAEWTPPIEPRPKKPIAQTSAVKVMASVFWDAHGILFIDYLPKGKTINSEYYKAIVDRLANVIKQKQPHMAKKKPLFVPQRLLTLRRSQKDAIGKQIHVL